MLHEGYIGIIQWAGAHHDWLLPQWRKVLFSDESRFELVSGDYQERIWKERSGQKRLATVIGIDVLINMFEIRFMFAACIAVVVVAKSDVKQVKISLRTLFESIKCQAESSFSEASEDTENVASEVKDGSDIIEKIRKCLKQIMDKGKSKADAIVEEFKKILNDIAKLKDCKGTKQEKESCIKNVIAFIKQDINDLKDKSADQIQWLINDVLPDFYLCVTAK
nr:unnamed protein product [Callosobruchus chinensis]